ncbi:filamentous hemagglutinin N-terminal domain-containing protein [Orbus sturtevantii]|uniref:two-partner secretion domain-containing protein n=1 Tax=Orbus sturtevantii TaxID=3074109 RepID=UPI00370D670E
MNKHFYRIIFNKARGIMMVVAEIVKRHQGEGRSSQKATSTASHSKVTAALKPLSFLTFVALGMVSIVTHSQASTIISDNSAAQSQRPTIIERPNGPTVVNIQEANKAGVSHNKYNQFDVSRDGVILNNSAQSSNTQLGGNIAGNSNLAHSGGAKVILNEINSANASQLNGKIEVAGQKAQVVIANAAGITCNGCGFINADRATLTTGSAIIGEDGKLVGYQVEQGNITINGEFDSREQDYTDLIARAVSINGKMHANDLTVIAGKNKVSQDLQKIEKLESNDAKPELAIDVAALGGMYANKIILMSTETGVGVYNAGKIARASTYDTFNTVSITADGKITNINSGSIGNEYNYDSGEGLNLNININGSQGIDNEGGIYGGNVTLVSQQTINNNYLISSLNNLTLQAKDVYNTSSIYADNVNVIADGKIVNTKTGFLSSISGDPEANVNFNGQKGIENEGVIYSGNIYLASQQAISNSGKLSAGNFAIARFDSLSNYSPSGINLTGSKGIVNEDDFHDIIIDGKFTNTGSIWGGYGEFNLISSQSIDNFGKIYGKNVNLVSQQAINNQGSITADNNVTLQGSSVNNAGLIDNSFGYSDLNITVDGLFNNTGRIEAKDKDINLSSSQTINNKGEISAKNINIASQQAINNSGRIKSADTMNLALTTLNNNVGGLIYSGGALNIGKSLNNQGNATGKANAVNNHSATIEAKGNVTITAKEINNINDTFKTEETFLGTQTVKDWSLDEGRTKVYTSATASEVPGIGKIKKLNVAGEGSYFDYYAFEYDKTTYETQVVNKGIQAKISSGTNLTLSADKVTNYNSILGGNRHITGTLKDEMFDYNADNKTTIVDGGKGYSMKLYNVTSKLRSSKCESFTFVGNFGDKTKTTTGCP